nr:pentapeptide repeat-containing protein [Nostoc parmelioides]
MILLLELHRYAKTKDDLKDKIDFYLSIRKYGDDKNQELINVINYSNSINIKTFTATVGHFLSYANLQSANLIGSYLNGVNLKGANLQGANLIGTYLNGANFESANLQDVNLIGTYLNGANFESANLENANFLCAYLNGAYFIGAYFNNTNINDSCLKNTDFEGLT